MLTIETVLNESHGAVDVILSDTGHGLTNEMRERLFLPYFSTKQRGTGLGLAIAAKIIQEHGGTIRAESNTPAGARFIVELPLAEEMGWRTPQKKGRQDDRMNHLLIVDDEAEIRESSKKSSRRRATPSPARRPPPRP